MPPKDKLWPLEPHTVGKHKVLRSYLDAWLPILGSWAGRIVFIDGFAGPGEYRDGEEGSPLIAMRALRDHSAAIKAEVCFLFIEGDSRRAAHLKELVDEWKPTLPGKIAVDVIEGRFDETMTALLDGIKLAPALVMVDPFGVSDTPMAVLRRILKNDRAEVYVSFMYEAINRFKAGPEFEKHLDGLFGCDTWRKGLDIADAAKRKDFFYGLYKDQLRAAGAKYVVHFELYSGNRLIYAIFFATQSTKGCDRMKQAIWKIAPFGEFAFRGTRSRQLTFGLEQVDYEPLKRALVAEFRGKGWVTIEEVLEFVASDKTDYHTGQAKKPVLAPMETAGEIEVDDSTRKKKRTYPEGTKLRFR